MSLIASKPRDTGLSGLRHVGTAPIGRFFDMRLPSGIMHVFLGLAGLGVLVVTALIGLGIHHVYRGEMIRDAEVTATSVAEAILEQERDVLLKRAPGGAVSVALAIENAAAFDQRMRRLLHPFGIYKIKIYDMDARILYSTDATLIGRVDAGNAKLGEVLSAGRINSAVDKKGQIADLGGGVRFDADVVETYLPIQVAGRTIGSFEVYLDISRTYDQIGRVFALSIMIVGLVLTAAFSALYWPMRSGAARLDAIMEELHLLAATDPLTGILNRRSVIAQAQSAQAQSKACAGGAVVMIDIDHFKAVNDRLGHPSGDEVLRKVSAVLRSRLRQGDLIGRYGGEEFLVVLPGARLTEAAMVAERLRRAVAATDFGLAGLDRPVTVSVGISPWNRMAEDVLTAIGRADRGLYRAKADGRDCVRVITEAA
ncbi:MAG TPA: GGDEF domain-containing protein [Azospirillum sp.]|nr:GGDEF domain-containing protein [Azospirillum sp.]